MQASGLEASDLHRAAPSLQPCGPFHVQVRANLARSIGPVKKAAVGFGTSLTVRTIMLHASTRARWPSQMCCHDHKNWKTETAMENFQDRIRPSTFGIVTYLGNIRAGKYQIPTFQREVVWEKENVKKLWDSVYKFYPLGSILVWKTPIKLHSHRKIGGHPLVEDAYRAEYQYLLDGQQRTTALYTSLFGGEIEGREHFDPTVFLDLTVPLDGATDDDSYKERFLFLDEIDDRGGELLKNSGRQKRFREGRIVKLADVHLRFSELDRPLDRSGYDYDSPERETLRRMQSVLANYNLSLIELNGIQVSEVCQIFERINRAGKPLDIFDIVVAKTFRAADSEKGVTEFYLRALFDSYRKSPEMAGSSYAELDNHTFLRMLAVCVRIKFPDAGIFNVTDRYLNELKAGHIETVWESASKAFTQTFKFLHHVLRLHGPNLIPYGYLYLTLAAYFFENDSPSIKALSKYFWYTALHRDDLLSNTTQLWKHIESLRSGLFVPANDGAGEPLPFIADREALRATSYSSRGRLSRGILALYASSVPKDWGDGHIDVLSSVYYCLTDQPNLHHIFPQDFVAGGTLDRKELSDSLLNVAYLTQLTNLRISNKNPVSYLRDYLGESDGERDQFREVLKSHLVPERVLEWCELAEMPNTGLNDFVEARADLVVAELRRRLEGVPFVELDSRATDGAMKSNSGGP
jgi:hypothetical protein